MIVSVSTVLLVSVLIVRYQQVLRLSVISVHKTYQILFVKADYVKVISI